MDQKIKNWGSYSLTILNTEKDKIQYEIAKFRDSEVKWSLKDSIVVDQLLLDIWCNQSLFTY